MAGSPVFDVAEQVRLVDLAGEDDGSQRGEPESGFARSGASLRTGVNVLVCGAFQPLEALLAKGIRVISLVCGDVEEVVKAFRNGTLRMTFAMPAAAEAAAWRDRR